MARAIQPHLERQLAQPIVIENRSGAGGVTGTEAVARSAPDGYTIGIGGAGALAVNLSLKEKMPYDPFTELAPISGLIKTPFILAAAPNFEPNAVRDVIALAKRQPGVIAIGHGGNGTGMHLTAQLFNHMAGIDTTLVPYRGTGPATQDLLAGHIPLAITDPPTAASLIQSKQIKALAVTTRQRFEAMPGLPTMERGGGPFNPPWLQPCDPSCVTCPSCRAAVAGDFDDNAEMVPDGPLCECGLLQLIAFQKALYAGDQPNLRFAITGEPTVQCPHCRTPMRVRIDQIKRRRICPDAVTCAAR